MAIRVVARREPISPRSPTAGREPAAGRRRNRARLPLLRSVASKAITALIPDGLIPREAVIRLNAPVLVFSVLIAMRDDAAVRTGAGAPHCAGATSSSRSRMPAKASAAGSAAGSFAASLVVVEVALSLLLLVGAGLLMRSFVALQTVDLGLDPENVLVARILLCRAASTRRGRQTALLP